MVSDLQNRLRDLIGSAKVEPPWFAATRGGSMPTKNALATIRFGYSSRGTGPYHISLEVWSHSYDHPEPNHRSAMVVGVELIQSPAGISYGNTNLKITDRYGIDQTSLWREVSGTTLSFVGHTEWDAGNTCGPAVNGVVWGNFTGIYDERCLADLACDSMRLQSYLTGPTQLKFIGFHYVAGPLTFAFDADLSAPPNAVRLKMGHIGGNGGNAAQRWATLPDEEFVIQFS
jgi:hypothetical protein